MAVTREQLWRMYNTTESDLFRWVIDDILELHGDTDEEVQSYLQKVYENGGQSGAITSLIYHKDCRKFVTEHIDECLEVYNETIEFYDPKEELSVDYLAWLSYEYVVNCILSEEPVADFIV